MYYTFHETHAKDNVIYIITCIIVVTSAAVEVAVLFFEF